MISGLGADVQPFHHDSQGLCGTGHQYPIGWLLGVINSVNSGLHVSPENAVIRRWLLGERVFSYVVNDKD